MDSDYSIDRFRIPRLTGPNYHQWSIQIQQMLLAQDLWWIIEPASEPVPAAGNKESDKQALSPAVLDAKVTSMILNNCTQEPMSRILILKTARERWLKLKALYAPLGEQQLGIKLMAFNAYKLKSGRSSIADITTDLDTLQAEIGMISSEERPTDRAKLTILLNVVKGMGARYDTITTQLEIAGVKNYDNIVAHLEDFERRFVTSQPSKENALLTMEKTSGKPSFDKKGQQKKKRFNGNCFYCQKPGHIKAECQSRKRDEAGKGGQPSTGPLATPGGGRGLSPQAEGAQVATEVSWIASESAF